MLNKSHKRTRPLFLTMRLGFLSFALASLAACATTKLPGSAAGLSEVIPTAEYVVLGKTQYDQDFVDACVVAGDTVGHAPPKPRPPELDKAPGLSTAPPVAAHKPTLHERLKA